MTGGIDYFDSTRLDALSLSLSLSSSISANECEATVWCQQVPHLTEKYPTRTHATIDWKMRVLAVVIGLLVIAAEAFLPPLRPRVPVSSLDAQKKRRRRKPTPAGGVGEPAVLLPPPEPVSTANEAKRVPPPPVEPIATKEAVPALGQQKAPVMTDDKTLIAEIAKFKFTPDDVITRG